MRRPPGLWILLSAGVVWLSLQDVYGIRATSLIFGKSTTTTTTTTQEPEALEEEIVTTEFNGDPNTTKPTLTGNPQLDYIWDPNLPKELNGFNLSDYPFYERVPEDIDFKCDGLHDGFYASVQHKCQVYHHCLFGTRYDFLCANYTAFDQKTFICHFASEVDCANSKNFWHRNDALYKSETTTTIKPFVIHTSPPKPSPITFSTISIPSGPGPRRPIGGRRRRRPQLDYYEDEYYDDYYEERPRSYRGRKRPRPRPRPLYDEEYDEEYVDDRYVRRGGSRREENRRPYNMRPIIIKRNKERDQYDYDDGTKDRFEDEDLKLTSRRKSTERKKMTMGDESEDSRYPESRQQFNDRRQPPNDRSEENEKNPVRKLQRRPLNDYEDGPIQLDYYRDYHRRRKNGRQRSKPKEETRTIIKPVSGTIYDRPRLAPKIKRPVPKNQADKYAYKPIMEQVPSVVQEDEEYYDDYEEEPIMKRNRDSKKPALLSSRDSRPKDIEENESSNSRKQMPPASRSHLRRPNNSYERSKSTESKNEHKLPVSEEYYDEYEAEEKEEMFDKNPIIISKSRKRAKSSTPTSTTASTTTTTTTTTTQTPINKIEQPPVRLVKRPFLPSRGGNPFAARGLQPVGIKAVENKPEISLTKEKEYNQEGVIEDSNIEQDNTKYEEQPYLSRDAIKSSEEIKPLFRPSPVIIKMPVRVKPVPINSENLRSRPNVPQNYNPEDFAGPRTTQKPKIPERNPLDITEDDYDVTLNDALNPTLPNLPVRGLPAGFSSANDYIFNGFQRPKYGSDPALNAATLDYVYQAKPQMQGYIPQSNTRDYFVNSNTELKGQYRTIRENYKPRLVQQQTEAFYSGY